MRPGPAQGVVIRSFPGFARPLARGGSASRRPSRSRPPCHPGNRVKKTAGGIILPMAITLKTAEDLAGMRIAGRLASEVLDMLTQHVNPGVTTEQLDKLAHDHIVTVQGAIPAPLNYAPPGYTPYPKSICTSVNHQVCHGIPNERALK